MTKVGVTRAQAVAYWMMGATYGHIGQILGMAKSTVFNFVNDYLGGRDLLEQMIIKRIHDFFNTFGNEYGGNRRESENWGSISKGSLRFLAQEFKDGLMITKGSMEDTMPTWNRLVNRIRSSLGLIDLHNPGVVRDAIFKEVLIETIRLTRGTVTSRCPELLSILEDRGLVDLIG